MIAYRSIFTILIGFTFFSSVFSQEGTIKVEKRKFNAEIFGLQSNRTGSPQSFILLINGTKVVFINSYMGVNLIWDQFFNDETINGKVIPGMYKLSGNQIFIFLAKGVQFKGHRINDALFLRDNSGNEVVFYKIYK